MNIKFLTKNKTIKDIQSSLYTISSLKVLSIIIGKKHTGKKTLVKSIFPNYPFINAENIKTLKEALKKYDKLIIYNFESIYLIEDFNFTNKQIIAIANINIENKILENFAFKFFMPELKDRKEDITLLGNLFLKQAKKDLDIKKEVDINFKNLDISNNNHSLKASIYRKLFLNSLNKKDLKDILYEYFLKNLNEENGYYENLDLYDETIIKAGLKKYKSQLKLSKVLGINRNTLRKKIEEYKID